VKNGEINLDYVKETSKNVGGALASPQKYKVVVVKSTVVPATTEKVVIPILKKYSRKKVGEFGVCLNPEFLTGIESHGLKIKATERISLLKKVLLKVVDDINEEMKKKYGMRE